MDAPSNTSIVIAKTLLLLFVLMMLAIFLMRAPLTSSIARVQTGERVLENTVPKHVPIKLKIKKEKERSFKDLNDEKWISEFELELTNTGDKPIYYIDLLLVSDVKLGGTYLVFPLAYGRDELGDIVSKARPDDIPIKPGETFVFKIHPGQIPAWEKSVREGKHPEAKRLQIKIEALSFGDGTGYFGNSGTLYPPGSWQQSGLNGGAEEPERMESKRPRSPRIRSGTRARTSTIADMPVSFLPANFLFLKSSVLAAPAKPLPADGCLFDECVGVIPARVYMSAITVPIKIGPPFIQPAFARSLSMVRCNVRLEPKPIYVKLLTSSIAVLGRDLLQCPLPHRFPRPVSIAQTQTPLAPRTVPVRLTRPAVSTKFKGLGAAMQ